MNPEPQTLPQRLASIDALRGFDMFMIAGGGTFIFLLKGKTGLGFIDSIADQFVHPEWHGFTFYDFIFPLFLFLAGTSLPFSLTSGLSGGITKQTLLRKVFSRMLILIIWGILDKNAPIDIFDPAEIRYGNVLGRIGIGSFISAILYLNYSCTKRLLIALSILIGYYLVLLLVPVSGYGAGDFSFEGNLVGWFDRSFMPGKLKQGSYDELALLTTFPAICLTIFGTLAGDVLLQNTSASSKLKSLFTAGIIGIITGAMWNLIFPVNKHLWSSSFILLTSGMAFSILAFFYWIIDVKGWHKWAFFFRVIGMNSLVIYLLVRFVDFNASSRLFFEGLYMHTAEKWHEVFNALGGLLLVWLVLYFFYKNKIFIKV